jgi:hypothetical protein
MYHSFDTDVAALVGVNAAIIFNNIAFWIKKNEANEENYYDGCYWTYNTKAAWRTLFPYMGEKQFKAALQKLIDEGLLKTGCYNSKPFDRTLWYALTEKGYSMFQNGTAPKAQNRTMEEPKRDSPIPYINTYINTDINNNPPISPQGGKRERAKPFTPPDIDEVRAYCKDRANGIDPDEWYDFYVSKGWMVGKNKMVDWKAAVRTWENKRRTAESSAVQTPPPEEQRDYHQKMAEQTREAIKTLKQAEEMEDKRREVLREYFDRTGKSVVRLDADKP